MSQQIKRLQSEIDPVGIVPAADIAMQCAQFRAIAENAPVILWLTDMAGEAIFFNQKWLNFTGLTRDEVTTDTWVNALHPGDRERCLKQFEEAVKSQEPIELEYRLQRFDGEFRFMIDNGKPLWVNGELIGYVGCTVDITELKETANKLNLSHSELRLHASKSGLLREMNEYLQVCHSVDETYPIFNYYAQQLFSDASGSLCIINESRSVVEAQTTWGTELQSQELFTPDDCWALRKGKIHSVDNPKTDLNCKHMSKNSGLAYLCVPMIAQGEVMGVLHLERHRNCSIEQKSTTHQVETSRKELAATTAENLAIAMASLKLREALRFQSIRDPLTHLFNRRYMQETFERELCRAKRNKTNIGVIMIDVDHFKRYNDNHGHDVGDAVLSELGRFLNAQVRGEDIACRYGGEEIVLVLPDAGFEAVLMRAEQIRTDIASIKLDHKQKPVGSITVSMGVAVYPEHGSNAEDLINAADAALYKAKRGGRNQVVVAEGLLVEATAK